VPIAVSVAYGTDPERVTKALLDVVDAAGHEGLEGLLLYPPPGVSLNPGFGDSSLNFTLGVQVREFRDQFRVQSELRKRILARFAKEGIEMPYPVRTIVLDKSSLNALGKPPANP
jgi:small-conductance mechanosensitive channel